MRHNSLYTKAMLVMALFCTTMGMQAQVEKVPSVDIQASAQKEVMPDELKLSIIIRESDYKGKTTLEEKQREMIEVLKANKIDYEEDLTIREMGSVATFKMFSRNPNPRSEVTYFLRLSDSAKMMQVVEQLEEHKITNIDLIETRYTKADELKLTLGQEAIRKAKAEAESLATAIGQNIGKAINVTSWMSNNAPRPRIYRMAAMNAEVADDSAGMEKAEPTPHITGILYTVNVSAKFELK